jgi:AbiV family abortive infection protein
MKNVNEAIVANCKRLLSDAQVLLEKGSPGSALSLAILAFEEVGKGQHLELEIVKTNRNPSWHQFRQVVAAFVLMASVFQKYGLQFPQLPAKAQELLEARMKEVKTNNEFAQKPVPEEFRAHMREPVGRLLEPLGHDATVIFAAEMLWAKKIFMAVLRGDVEDQRQRGIYVDLDGDEVESTPAQVSGQEAYYWISVTERALLLLEKGEYRAPFGELARVLEKMPRPFPKGQALVDMLTKIQVDPTDILLELGNFRS